MILQEDFTTVYSAQVLFPIPTIIIPTPITCAVNPILSAKKTRLVSHLIQIATFDLKAKKKRYPSQEKRREKINP